jgi:hypothetical protein
VTVLVRNIGISLAIHASVFVYAAREAGMLYPVPFHRWVLMGRYLRVELSWLRCMVVAVCVAATIGSWFLACRGGRGWARMAAGVVAANAVGISAAAYLCRVVWGGGSGAVHVDVVAELVVDALTWPGVVVVFAVLSGVLGTWVGGKEIGMRSHARSGETSGGAA